MATEMGQRRMEVGVTGSIHCTGFEIGTDQKMARR